MAVASLSVSKTYVDGQSLTEAKLDTSFQSIQTYTNTSLVNNFNQIRKDAFGSATTSYDYDNDGNANLTNPLINKQSASVAYTNSITVTRSVAAYALVSASLNLRVAPEVVGKYMVGFEFDARHRVQPSGEIFSRYAIVNRTSGATIWAKSFRTTNPDATNDLDITVPIHLSRLVNFASTAAATFTIYVKNTAVSNSASHQFIGSASVNAGVYGYAYKI